MNLESIQSEPIRLAYAPPPNLRTLARLPITCAAAISLIIPGFGSMLLGAPHGGKKLMLLSGSVIVAFIFFGPIWGEVLFKGTRYRDAGFIPFLSSCACSMIVSVLIAMRDWNIVRNAS